MQWQALQLVDVEPKTPKKLRDALATLQRRVEKLQTERESLNQRAEAVRDAPISSDSLDEMEAIRRARIIVWQDELNIRTDYGNWLDLYLPVVKELRDKAYEEMQSRAIEVTEKLVAIGYVVAEATSDTVGKITPGMVNGHPLVVEARNRHANLESGVLGYVTDRAKNNREATKKTVEEMEGFKRKAAGASLA